VGFSQPGGGLAVALGQRMTRTLCCVAVSVGLAACAGQAPPDLQNDSGGGSNGSAECPTVAVDTTPGRWRTARDATSCRFHVVSDAGEQAQLRGISMTGIETGTRETASGGGFWLFNSATTSEATNAPAVLANVTGTLASKWKSSVVRIPICSSAWATDYTVKDYANVPIKGYRDWLDVAIAKARASGAVVIIDNHLWAIAKMGKGTTVDRGSFTSNGATHKYADYEDGCTGVNKVGTTDSCAPQDFGGDQTTWECPIANADGVSLHNAYYNKDKIRAVWKDIATRYKNDSGVWFELMNEPYVRKAAAPFPADGVNLPDSEYPWDLWTEYMQTEIAAIRDDAGASNMILVNGLDFGYDFGPEYGPIAHPEKYLPWAGKYPNIAYAFHPYQHGSCCGAIGAAGTDLSATDPYESAFCSYYPGGAIHGAPSNAALPLPGGETCSNNGYAETADKKMPPCTWVATAWNPKTNAMGLCAGDRATCGPKDQAACDATDPASPDAGGWSKYVLPMSKYGPLIATEYGSFDCSSPYVKTLLDYMDRFGISYTAWALWSQNSGGPAGLGACGYPSVMTPTAAPGDFRACVDPAACSSLMQPLPWSGTATFQALTSP
jgi:hypothetical protein